MHREFINSSDRSRTPENERTCRSSLAIMTVVSLTAASIHMIVPFRTFLLGLLLLVPCLCSAQEKERTAQFPGVADLVEQLGSKQREARQSAERQLIDRGPRILDRLPEYDAVKSPDVRSALYRIRQALEDQRIDLSLRGTTFEFPDRELTLAEAVKMIRETTGNDLRISETLEMPKEPIRFVQEEITFWEAVIRLIEKYQLGLEVAETGRGLVFVAGKSTQVYFTSVDESGLAVAWRLNKVERKPIAGRQDEELLRFEMQMVFEPRLTPLYARISGNQLAYDTSDDETGSAKRERLQPFSPEAVTEIACHQLPISPAFRVDWMIPAGQQISSASIYPEAEITLAVGRSVFEFDDWEKSHASLRRGLAVVVRDELLITDDEVSFLLILLFSQRGAPFESHREWLSQNLIELKSGDQILKPKVPPEKELEADGSVAFRYRFERPQGNPENWILLYRFPTSFRTIDCRTYELIKLDDRLQPSKQENNPQ
jgi:hypothetical protein